MMQWIRRRLNAMKKPIQSKRKPNFRPGLESLADRLVPATFTVNNASQLTSAVVAANANGPGLDTINLNPGYYLLTAELGITSNISFHGTGTSPTKVVIDGQNAVRDFNVTANALTVSWSNLTITGGNASDGGGVLAGMDNLAFNNVIVNENNASGDGGGIHQAGGRLTMTNSQVTNNTAGSTGGGYENEGEMIGVPGSVQVIGSRIADNFAGTDGGGIYAANTDGVVLTRSQVDGNTAARRGGGVVLDSNTGGVSLTMNSSTIDSNQATDLHDGDGGGVYIAQVKSGSSSTIVLNSSHIDGNSSTDDGGGIDAEDMDGGVTITLTSSTVTNNVATGPHLRLDGSINNAFGGGINMEMSSGVGSLTLVGSSLSGNSSQFAGGIHLDAGPSASASIQVLSNSHVDNNRAIMGGGIDLHGDAAGGGTLSATIDHSSVSGNSATQDGGGIAAHTFGDALTINVSVNLSTISNNTAGTDGGGILATAANAASNVNVTVTRSTVTGNHADGGSGGGIYTDAAPGNAAVTMTQSTVNGNTASAQGGGIYLNNNGSGTSIFVNDTISNNIAGTNGGGIQIDGNTNKTYLVDLTIAANWAWTGTGGGIQNNAGTDVSLGNSIIALNTAGAAHTPDDLKGTFDYTFAGVTPLEAPNIASSLASVVGSNFALNPFNIFGNPQLGPLAFNPCTYSPRTATRAITLASPAAFKGSIPLDNAFANFTALLDQRGFNRQTPHPGKVDLGAYD